MKASTLILSLDSDTNVYNGHIQTELNSLPEKTLIALIEELYQDEKNQNKNLFLSLYPEENGYFSLSLYQKDYWKKGENKDFIDRMILSVDKINYENNYDEFLKYLNSKDYLTYEIVNTEE